MIAGKLTIQFDLFQIAMGYGVLGVASTDCVGRYLESR